MSEAMGWRSGSACGDCVMTGEVAVRAWVDGGSAGRFPVQSRLWASQAAGGCLCHAGGYDGAGGQRLVVDGGSTVGICRGWH
jgi:hypothetical protein